MQTLDARTRTQTQTHRQAHRQTHTSVSLPHSCDNVWDDSAVWAIGGERYTVRPSTSTTTRSPCHASISTSVRRTRSSECSGSSCTNPRRPDPASSCLSPPRTRPSAPHSCTPTSPQAWALVPVQMPGAGSEKLEKATAVHVYCALHVSVPSHLHKHGRRHTTEMVCVVEWVVEWVVERVKWSVYLSACLCL